MSDLVRWELARTLAGLRERAPLIHCLTATVSMGIVADGLLAAGARPMMTETEEEAPTLVTAADALLVNLGTLSTDGLRGIPATVDVAAHEGTPWVLDPTAVGLAPARTPLARELLARRPDVVRGNASEVLVLAGRSAITAGPDAGDPVDAAADAARRLAREHGIVLAVSGEHDLVTDGERTVRVRSGHALLTRVSGTGCLLGALTAACLVAGSPTTAAVAATALLTVAAERAAPRAGGPGSFRVELLDALAGVTPDEVAEEVRL